MAFPEYGLSPERYYAIDGFQHADFLFKAIAGLGDTPTLYYLALTFAMVGGLSFLLVKSLRTTKTVVGWLLLVLITIIYPKSEPLFFYNLTDTGLSPSLNQNIDLETHDSDLKDAAGYNAFTPQLAVVDLTSRLHRAIFDGFFKIDPATGDYFLRNKVGDLEKAIGHVNHPDMNLGGMGEAIQEIGMYENLRCGAREDLLKEPYKAGLAANSLQNTSRLPEGQAKQLRNTTFTLGQIHNEISTYFDYYQARSGTYPYDSKAPFAVIFDNENNVKDAYSNMGIGANNVDKLVKNYTTSSLNSKVSPGEHAKELTVTMSYLIVNEKKITNKAEAETTVCNGAGAIGSILCGDSMGVLGFDDTNGVKDAVEQRIDILSGIRTDRYPNDTESTNIKEVKDLPVGLGVLRIDTGVAVTQEYAIVYNCEQLHKNLREYLTWILLRKTGHDSNIFTKDIFDKLMEEDGMNATIFNKFPSEYQPDDSIDVISYRDAYNRLYAAQKDDGLVPDKEYIRQAMVESMLTPALHGSYGETAVSANKLSDIDKAIMKQRDSNTLAERFNAPAGWLGMGAKTMGDIGAVISAQWEGATAIAYIRYLKLMLGIAILFIIIVTPLLFLIGLLIPTYASGVLILSTLALLVVKMVPITFTVIDVIVSLVLQITSHGLYDSIDKALIIHVVAGLYTSIVAITLFLMFKAGDPSSVGQLGQLDSAAKQIAETGKGFAVAALGVAGGTAIAGVSGAAGGIASSVKNSHNDENVTGFGGTIGAIGRAGGAGLARGAKQGSEVITGGATSIPIIGKMLQEAHPGGAFREAHAEQQFIDNIDNGGEVLRKARHDAKYKEAQDKVWAAVPQGADRVGDFGDKYRIAEQRGKDAALQAKSDLLTNMSNGDKQAQRLNEEKFKKVADAKDAMTAKNLDQGSATKGRTDKAADGSTINTDASLNEIEGEARKTMVNSGVDVKAARQITSSLNEAAFEYAKKAGNKYLENVKFQDSDGKMVTGAMFTKDTGNKAAMGMLELNKQHGNVMEVMVPHETTGVPETRYILEKESYIPSAKDIVATSESNQQNGNRTFAVVGGAVAQGKTLTDIQSDIGGATSEALDKILKYDENIRNSRRV